VRAGANLPAVGGYNQTVILDAIRRSADGVSRVEIAERTGLSAQTVSNVCRRLLDDELIVEAGTQVVGVGKPRTILKLEPRGRFAVGVHLDPSVITVVLLDLAGSVIAHRAIQTSDAERSAQTIELIARVVDDVTVEAEVDASRVMGIGIAAPGPVDLVSGTVLNPPLLAGWKNVPIRDALAQRLGMPVLLEKDVTAAVVAELWLRADAEHGNLAFFYYGTGIGAGLVIQNEVVRGFSSNAGDIGHVIVGGSGGHRWKLGDAVMPRFLVRDAIERGALTDPAPGMQLTRAQVRASYLELANAALAGEPVAVDIFNTVGRDIATGLTIVINLLDINRVVFGGPFWSPIARFMLDRVPANILESPTLVSPHTVGFAESAIGDDVAAVGAACLVLDNAFSPRATGLLIKRSAHS
jgi:predicted NBD/HSP70 family sugar kinase